MFSDVEEFLVPRVRKLVDGTAYSLAEVFE